MTSEPEEDLDDPVNRKKQLGLSNRLDPSHLTFSLSSRTVGLDLDCLSPMQPMI